MTNPRRPQAPWSRLRPAQIDPLESMGLVSKGDERHVSALCRHLLSNAR